MHSETPFSRLVREIFVTLQSDNLVQTDIRFQSSALLALQCASESYLTGIFTDSYCLTIHRGRKTLQPKDITLAMILRGEKTLESLKKKDKSGA